MSKELVSLSKFLSLVLRHQPEAIGIQLDEHGWVDVDVLLAAAAGRGKTITRATLERIVAENDKKRFAFSDDGRRIRASQGHSVEVDLALQPSAPPQLLYHGTATRFLDSIRQQGLVPGKRQHVHLSRDEQTATAVGQRHGKPVVLVIRAHDMASAGHRFYLSDNNVWLTEHVPVEFILFG